MAKTVVVKQKEGEEVPTEVLAEAIVAISQGVRKLRAGRLNDRALTMLIAAASPFASGGYPRRKPTQGEVRAVLEGIEGLEKTFLKKKPEASK